MPQSVIVSTTRSITWRRTVSRSGVPSVPRKYFWATMLVALNDQLVGHLDVQLLEGDRAVTEVRYPRVAAVPGHLVVRVTVVAREVTADANSESLGCNSHFNLSFLAETDT